MNWTIYYTKEITKIVSPADSRLIIKTVDQTVHATSGKLAASLRETPVGTGRTCAAGTATFSAYPPPLSRAHTYITPPVNSIQSTTTIQSCQKAYSICNHPLL
jgi:hypothetical protein